MTLRHEGSSCDLSVKGEKTHPTNQESFGGHLFNYSSFPINFSQQLKFRYFWGCNETNVNV